jgi:glycosyltransferase involved in cell wall biosynthesis
VKVALVHDWLTGTRGGEKVLEVFCELFPQADLYTLIYLPEKVSPSLRCAKVYCSWINRLPKIQNYYRYCLPFFPHAVERFSLRDYDFVLSSSHCVAKGIVPGRALHIAYVHSPMRYIWDQHDAYFVTDSSWISQAGMALCRSYLQQWDIRSSDRVNFFIANSNNVAAKIRKLYNREAAVIYPPVDLDRFELSTQREPYYLIVSALVPYKRLDIAIDAFNRLNLPLKIAGEGPLRNRLEKKARPNIEFLGWVSDQRLASLYASCQALIFPGEEDFGIVPLEAQACGRPVIAYGKGGTLETVVSLDTGGSARATGIFFTDQTAESLMAAVRVYQANRDGFEPAEIRQHVCRFSRDRFKAQISAYIEARLRDSAGK